MQKIIRIPKNKDRQIHIVLKPEKEYDITFMLAENTSLSLYMSTKSTATQKYNYRVKVLHTSPDSKSFVQMNAVLYDESEVKMYGSIVVQKGISGVDAMLKQKVVLMSEKAKITLDPVMEIDDNRLTGSHAAVVSSPNPDHLYYLSSRGLSEANAKELLVQSLLNIPEGYSTMEI